MYSGYRRTASTSSNVKTGADSPTFPAFRFIAPIFRFRSGTIVYSGYKIIQTQGLTSNQMFP